MSENNKKITASILYAVQLDQQKRQQLIKDLYNTTLAQNNDIEGKPIKTGALKTIVNNLTYVNYKNYNPHPENYTPQALDTGDIVEAVLKFNTLNFDLKFKWNEVDPVLFYVKGDPVTGGGLCPKKITNLKPSDFAPDSYLSTAVDRRSFPIGFYQKPNSTNFHVKIEVTIPYSRQIFFPIKTAVDFIAKASAKPFGAVFGPGENADILLPTYDSNNNDPAELIKNAPNHSLFPGDRIGLYARSVQWGWSKLFTSALDPNEEGLDLQNNCQGIADTDIKPQCENNVKKGLNANSYLFPPRSIDPMFQSNINLTIEPRKFFNNHLRILEEIAIAPDLFDAQYYTILPNYMTTLFPKIQKIISPLPDGFYSGYLPGDLGHRNNNLVSGLEFQDIQPPCYTSFSTRDPPPNSFRLNYIEKQINCANKFPEVHGAEDAFSYYKINKLDHLLTSWAPNGTLGECSQDDARVKIFGLFNANKPAFQKLIPGHCLQGGRTGFSVKLISDAI